MANQDAWALPLAIDLIEEFRCATLTFHRMQPTGTYDPATGTVTVAPELSFPGAGAVVSTKQLENDGTGQTHELVAWVEHGPAGVPFPVKPSDQLEYQGKRWRIIAIDPGLSGDVPYASKLTARAQ